MTIGRHIRWAAIWKVALRLGGLFILIHEALSHDPVERPVLYIAALAMMGISITVPVDSERHEKDGE